jgi:hypothetical protein
VVTLPCISGTKSEEITQWSERCQRSFSILWNAIIFNEC